MRFAYADLVAGTAAEYLVCADLLLAGFSAFRADQACPYDVVVDLGHRLARVQVKAAREPRPYMQVRQTHIVGYTWYCRQGKGATRAYDPTSFDVLALVALDTRRVAYLPAQSARQTVQIPVSGAKRLPRRAGFDTLTFSSAIGEGEQ